MFSIKRSVLVAVAGTFLAWQVSSKNLVTAFLVVTPLTHRRRHPAATKDKIQGSCRSPHMSTHNGYVRRPEQRKDVVKGDSLTTKPGRFDRGGDQLNSNPCHFASLPVSTGSQSVLYRAVYFDLLVY